MNILGLDPSLRRTGWGIISQTSNKLTHIANGTISPPHELEMPTRLLHLFNGLQKIIKQYQPENVGIETIFVNKNGMSTLKLGQARGVCLVACACFQLPISEYSPTKIKKSIIGSGGGGKQQVAHMVKTLLPKAQWQHHDESDALATAICHAHHVS